MSMHCSLFKIDKNETTVLIYYAVSLSTTVHFESNYRYEEERLTSWCEGDVSYYKEHIMPQCKRKYDGIIGSKSFLPE